MAFIGLNLTRDLGDVADKELSLRNIGLNFEDIKLIYKLSDSESTEIPITIDDLHTTAGLIEDQKKSFNSVVNSAYDIGFKTSGIRDISTFFSHNTRINNKLLVKSLKYNYLNLSSSDALAPDAIKKNDMSTLRLSAWSEITTDTITYSGKLKVIGDTIELTGGAAPIIMSEAPIPRSFRSEIANKTVKIKINGVDKKLVMMKGIPIVFNGYIKRAVLVINTSTLKEEDDRFLLAATSKMQDTSISAAVGTFGAGASSNDIPFTVRLTYNNKTYNSGDDTTANPGSIGSSVDTDNPSGYAFSQSRVLPYKIELFYDPSKISLIGLRNKRISEWTTVKLPELKILNLELNALTELPSFRDGTQVVFDLNNSNSADAVSNPMIEGKTYSVHTVGTTTKAEFNAGGLNESVTRISGGNLSFTTTNGQVLAEKGIKLAVGDTITISGNTDPGISSPSYSSSGSVYTVASVTGISPNITEFDITIGGSTPTTTDGNTLSANTVNVTSFIDVPFVYNGKTMGTGTAKIKKSEFAYAALAPKLEDLKIKGNYLYRSQYSANSQLNTLPLTIKKLEISGSFQDSVAIDLLDYVNLEDFTLDSNYITTGSSASGANNLNMIQSTLHNVSPAVVIPTDNKGIKNYTLYRQLAYNRLAEGVYKSKRLEKLKLFNMSGSSSMITGAENVELTGFRTVATDSSTAGSVTFAPTHNCFVVGDLIQIIGTIDGAGNSITGHTSGQYYTISAITTNSTNAIGFSIRPVPGSGNVETGNGQAVNTTAVIKAYGSNIPLFEDSSAISAEVKQTLKEIQLFRQDVNVINVSGCSSLSKYTQQYCRPIAGAYIPEHLSVVSKFSANQSLRTIDLIESTGIVGDINTAFQNLPELQLLNLRGSSVTGSLVTASFTGTEKLSVLTLDGTKIGVGADGVSADQFFGNACFQNTNLTNLQLLNVSNVKGSLPVLTTQERLKQLYITGSKITGGIPTFQENQVLSIINLSNNNLTGALPEIGFTQRNATTQIILSNNALSSAIPTLSGSGLKIARLDGNDFTGNLPSLALCANLVEFDAKDNKLSGYTVGSLATNEKIQSVNLSNNNLTEVSGPAIINDLYENYILKPRKGVNIQLTEQSGLTEYSIVNDGTGSGEGSTEFKLMVLRSNNWTISLDSGFTEE